MGESKGGDEDVGVEVVVNVAAVVASPLAAATAVAPSALLVVSSLSVKDDGCSADVGNVVMVAVAAVASASAAEEE